jgi:hypothetical protein
MSLLCYNVLPMGVKPDMSCNKAGIQESEIKIIDEETEHKK